ncbi:MAG: MASE1 domain-containing protein [Xanthobacteraceae bacterium]
MENSASHRGIRRPRTTGARLTALFLLKFAAVAAVYLLLAKLGLGLASINPSATPVWPPTGFALAIVLILGYPFSPAIFLGAFFANVTTAGTIATSLAIAAGNTVECLVGAYLINRWSDGARTFESPVSIAKFALIVFFAATPLSASIGVASLTLAGFAEWENVRSIWITWWLGDVAGALLFTPLIVLWARSIGQPTTRRNLLETIAIFAAAAAVALFAFSPLLPDTIYRSALGFLAILPLLWAALRRDQRDTATVAVILSTFAVWGALMGAGPFLRNDLNESFLLLLAFMISAALPSLALSAAVGVRKRAEEILRDNEARVRALAETAPSIIWTAAPDGTITFHNRQWLEYSGISPERNARDWPSLVLHPDDRNRCIVAWHRALETGTPYEIEVRNRRHDGEYRWFLTRATPVKDETGKIVEWFGSSTDVQQMKEAHTRQNLLLAELSHRVRNMLAVVQSIAARTVTEDRSPQEAKSILNDRLHALARAHDLLVESSWEGAPLEELVKAETEAFSKQMSLHGPSLILVPKAAQTIALLIHELTTNSCKHGALSALSGHVDVSWSIDGYGDDRHIRFSWTERGGPPVSPPLRKGFGLTLLERAVRLEFDRVPQIEFDPKGFRFAVDIPAMELLASPAASG